MKFGQVPDPGIIDFSIPEHTHETLALLKRDKQDMPMRVFVGCAKWNKTDLKDFYPKGTKDELSYYSTQFNSIELNATFYNSPSKEQVETWKNKHRRALSFFRKYLRVSAIMGGCLTPMKNWRLLWTPRCFLMKNSEWLFYKCTITINPRTLHGSGIF